MVSRSVRKPVVTEHEPPWPLEPGAKLFPVKEVGVDWITVTCNDVDSRPEFDDVGYSMLAREASDGNEVKPWSMKGFEGLNGGHISVGKRGDMSLIRLSSRLAWSNWRRPYELCTNCSRIDFQVTVSEVPQIDDFLRDREREAWTHASRFKRPPEVAFRFSNRTGSTLYLGARTSDSFARLYNKWSESKLDHYEGCVRCEVQFQNKLAQRTAFALSRAEDEAATVSGAVSGWIQTRGVSQLFTAIAGKLISCPRSRTTTARRLAWLDTQVRPAVSSLLETCDLEVILKALGLDQAIYRDKIQLDQQEKRR